MYDQVFSNLQKATESSIKMQQEMFQKWVEAFPAASSQVPTASDALSKWRHNWEALVAESLKRQKELVDKNYEAGIKALEDLFAVEEATSPQEYQQKVTELYRKSFESLRQLSEAQLSEFRSAAEKWSQLLSVSDA
jgi:hypothetical protein